MDESINGWTDNKWIDIRHVQMDRRVCRRNVDTCQMDRVTDGWMAERFSDKETVHRN